MPRFFTRVWRSAARGPPAPASAAVASVMKIGGWMLSRMRQSPPPWEQPYRRKTARARHRGATTGKHTGTARAKAPPGTHRQRERHACPRRTRRRSRPKAGVVHEPACRLQRLPRLGLTRTVTSEPRRGRRWRETSPRARGGRTATATLALNEGILRWSTQRAHPVAIFDVAAHDVGQLHVPRGPASSCFASRGSCKVERRWIATS